MIKQSAHASKETKNLQDTQLFHDLALKSQKLVNDFFIKNARDYSGQALDPLNISRSFYEMAIRLLSNPLPLFQAQFSLWQEFMTLWGNTTLKWFGYEAKPVIEPPKGDRRFRDEAWNEPFFDYIKQSYLLTARCIQGIVEKVEGVDDKTAQKIDFYTRQFVDALAPSNFILTNPQILKETIETNGENLMRGLKNLLEDLEEGKGQLAIKMTDTEAFKVGENLAITPGKVIYENDLMQLIQYSPTTKEVCEIPLLIIPPWINKYYILDLSAQNSLVRWLVQKGYTVFMISWVNPITKKYANKSFEDYLVEGPLTAMDVIQKQTKVKQANIVGYCLGGTLLGSLLAFLAAKKDTRVKSATFFAALIDFKEAGELSVFIDEEQLHVLEHKMHSKGYLEPRDMATTFNMLRANDLIWSFVVNNYLLGKTPIPFDLLYWNSDATAMPAKMHSFYLRKMYQKNLLSQPCGITLLDTPIDLRKVKVPTFILASHDDHIAPWQSVYVATQLYKGSTRFCLSGSGHIAGVVNPPEQQKYCYWVQDKAPSDPASWLELATRHEGSWWPEWNKWLKPYGGKKVPARDPSQGVYKPIEDAPGRYVKVKAS